MHTNHSYWNEYANVAPQAKPATVNVGGNGFAELRAAFQHARAVGLKRPKMHVGPFLFSLAPDNGRNAGYIYVKASGEYAGKIDPEGNYTANNYITLPPDVTARLLTIARDPKANAVQHGHQTGNCAICSRLLSDPESVQRGIGPKCAERMGW